MRSGTGVGCFVSFSFSYLNEWPMATKPAWKKANPRKKAGKKSERLSPARKAAASGLRVHHSNSIMIRAKTTTVSHSLRFHAADPKQLSSA